MAKIAKQFLNLLIKVVIRLEEHENVLLRNQGSHYTIFLASCGTFAYAAKR